MLNHTDDRTLTLQVNTILVVVMNSLSSFDLYILSRRAFEFAETEHIQRMQCDYDTLAGV